MDSSILGAQGEGKPVPTATGMGFGADFGETLGKSCHNSQSDSKMFLIALESLRNVVSNGYSHSVIWKTGNALDGDSHQEPGPGAAPVPAVALAVLSSHSFPWIPGHGHSCGQPQTPARGRPWVLQDLLSLPQWKQLWRRAGRFRKLYPCGMWYRHLSGEENVPNVPNQE